MKKHLLDKLTKSKAGESTVAICMVKSQRIHQLHSPRNWEPKNQEGQRTQCQCKTEDLQAPRKLLV